MADFYIGVNTADVHTMADPSSSGTSSTAGADIELRIGDGTVTPTKQQVILALKVFERWIIKNGLGAGASLPVG